MRSWVVLVVVAGLVGCVSLEESARQEAYDRTTRAYARVMQWSDFAGIAMFLPTPPDGSAFNPEPYREFKITGYQPAGPQVSADGRTVRRSAVISYVRISRMSEHSIQVQEEWKYSDSQKRWYLQGGLPVFK